MMKKAKRFLILGVLALATLSTAACGKKPAPVAPAPAVDDSADRARREAEERARRESEENARRQAEARAAAEAAQREMARTRSVLEAMVFFDYDDSTIRTDARAALDAKVQILRTQTAIRIRVVGHADERGSTEYNLAPGTRRAQSVREYMASYGIAADRIEIQTMGEERPLQTGHDDASWSRNRRGEFTILTGLRAGG